jgi:hypothetical protein
MGQTDICQTEQQQQQQKQQQKTTKKLNSKQ